MTGTHLYLSLLPQALVASMLGPEEFGAYYAVGRKLHIQGEAIFFEVDPAYRSGEFPFELVAKKCVPGPRGEPKKSVYLAIYRVLSRIPVAALGDLYLVTRDGLTLRLKRDIYRPRKAQELHLYQEFCPITPTVASKLEPQQFCRFITDPTQPVHVPRIVFSELKLHELATDPVDGAGDDLPYRELDHLRDCLQELKSTHKQTKLVLKQVHEGVLYRMVEGGFYVGDQEDFAFYAYPTPEQLEDEHRLWWRSAQHHPFICN